MAGIGSVVSSVQHNVSELSSLVIPVISLTASSYNNLCQSNEKPRKRRVQQKVDNIKFGLHKYQQN